MIFQKENENEKEEKLPLLLLQLCKLNKLKMEQRLQGRQRKGKRVGEKKRERENGIAAATDDEPDSFNGISA